METIIIEIYDMVQLSVVYVAIKKSTWTGN